MLSGGRGDLLTSGWSYNYWEKVLTGRWGDLWHELKADSQANQRSIQTVIYRQMIVPNHRAPKLRKVVRWLLGREGTPAPIYPFWVNDEFAKRTHLEETAKQHQSPPSPITEFGRQWRYELIYTHIQMRGAVWTERDSARFGIERADPWSDRRLAEFILAIPHDRVNKPREYKYITRQAMRGIMPEPARTTVKKIIPMPYYFDSLRIKARETIFDLIDNSHAHEHGYIDKIKLRRFYESMINEDADHADFWWILTVEMWLREFWS